MGHGAQESMASPTKPRRKMLAYVWHDDIHICDLQHSRDQPQIVPLAGFEENRGPLLSLMDIAHVFNPGDQHIVIVNHGVLHCER
jgi:hypothetical protein